MKTAAVVFVTVFLELVAGPQPVELRVASDVVAVEVRLDGDPVGRLEAAPWRLECDLGPGIRPHRLEAVAYAADGEVAGRATQLVNVSRPRAVARLEIGPAADGTRLPVGVTWDHVLGLDPIGTVVTVDGVRLEPDGPDRWSVDRGAAGGSPSLVSAEVWFPDGEVVRSVAAVGGSYGGVVETDLTAIAFDVRSRKDAPTVAELAGVFLTPAGPAEVVAVEQGAPRVLLVTDATAAPALRRMLTMASGRWQSVAVDLDQIVVQEVDAGVPIIRTVSTVPVMRNGRRAFSISEALNGTRLGLDWFATHLVPDERAAPRQALGDAVAVAGEAAAATGHPRAVALVLGAGGGRAGGQLPADAAGYLASLGVPLEIWRVDEPEAAPGWGEGRRIRHLGQLRIADRKLRSGIETQRVAWIEGSWLPTEISVADGVDRVALVGAEGAVR